MAWYPCTMRTSLYVLGRLKQGLLAISIVYFYGLAIILQFRLPSFGFDHPLVFAGIGALFLVALGIEVWITWWTYRRWIAWAVLCATCYGVIGLGIAPLLYGDIAIWIGLFTPLVLVFVGGFLYAAARVLVRAFSFSMKLPLEEIVQKLRTMPGWEHVSNGLEKTFRFASYAEAVEFVERAVVAARTAHREPDISLTRRAVRVRVTTPDVGVTVSDVDLANTLDQQ